MSIVYTETDENRSGVPHMPYGRQPADTKVTIFQHPHKVAFVTSRLIVGVPRGEAHKNKRYYYWRSVDSRGFRRNKNGNFIPYHCTRLWDKNEPWKHKAPHLALDSLEDRSEAGQAYAWAVWQTFNIKSAQDLYPMLDKFQLPTYSLIPQTVRGDFRAVGFNEFTTRVFGKKRTTPRLVAAVTNTEPYYTAVAKQFRGLVTDDKIVKFLEDNHFTDEEEEFFNPHVGMTNIRSFLLFTSQENRDALIQQRLDMGAIKGVGRIAMMGKNGQEYHGRAYNRRKATGAW